MALTLRRVVNRQLTWDEVDANWTAGRTFDGTVLLGGEATAWDDVVQPLVTAKQGQVDKPAWNATEGGFDFPQNDPTHILYLNVQMPHQRKADSAIRPHVHWHQAANQNPVFKMDYRWTDLASEVAGAWQTYTMGHLVFPYTSGTMHQILEGAEPLDGTGKGISSMLQVKLYRDDNVYTGTLVATSFDIHVEIDSFGSNTEFQK